MNTAITRIFDDYRRRALAEYAYKKVPVLRQDNFDLFLENYYIRSAARFLILQMELLGAKNENLRRELDDFITRTRKIISNNKDPLGNLADEKLEPRGYSQDVTNISVPIPIHISSNTD